MLSSSRGSAPDFYTRTPEYPTAADGVQKPSWLVNKGPSPSFDVLCGFFDKIQKERNHERRRAMIGRIIEEWRKRVGPDVYPLFRLMLPDRDRERPVYGVKEASLARAYVDVLGLDLKSDAAQRLIHWKQPRPGADQATGDFPTVCYEEIKKRKSSVERNDLSVEAINGLLDQLCRGKDKNHYTNVIKKIMHHLSAEQQRWLIRIILKDLKIGVRERTVFSLFHPDAIELFNVSSDLKRVCYTLADLSFRLPKTDAEVTLFRSFLPQLCKRSGTPDLVAIAKLMPNKPFLIEEKLDGERIQLHKRGREYFYCSRKAKDYGYLYGTHVGEGSLTPYIDSAFADNVENCILDGEMMVWDPMLGKYLAFGQLKSAALIKDPSPDSPRPCYKVFDILMLNGHCLTGQSVRNRKKFLQSGDRFPVFTPVPGRLELADCWEGNTSDDIKDRLEWVMENKGEGLVVKNPKAPYEMNGRTENWVKVKPEYADEMGENMDLLVLGGWWGQGRRSGKLSSLLLGLRDQHDKDDDAQRPTFTTFGKVGSGFSYSDYEWMQKHHGKDWIPFDRKKPPAWITFGAIGNDDKPDVIIAPEKSFVVEVKASEIVTADGNYGAGMTLRFPRAKFLRWDQASRRAANGEEEQEADARDSRPTDRLRDEDVVWDMWSAMSMHDMLDLSQNTKKQYQIDSSQPKKKRKLNTRKAAGLAPAFAGQDVHLDSKSHIFSGQMFFVIRGTKEFDKSHLERLIVEHGGDFCQRVMADDDTIVITNSEQAPQAQGAVRKGKSLVKPEWLLESIKAKRRLPLINDLVWHANEQDRAEHQFYAPLSTILTGATDFGKLQKMEEEEESEESEEIKADTWGLRGRNETGASLGAHVSETEEERSSYDSHTEADDDPDFFENGVKEEAQFPQPTEMTGDKEEVKQEPGFEAAGGIKDEEEGLGSATEDEEDEDPGATGAQSRAHSPKMGLADQGGNYDEDKIFSHLLVYIDSDENAEANDLDTKRKAPESAMDELAEIASQLSANGAALCGDINNPKITHIVQHDSHAQRYKELSRKTSEPYRKHIVGHTWATDSLANGSLLSESWYKPAS